jgi:hypothetical protein
VALHLLRTIRTLHPHPHRQLERLLAAPAPHPAEASMTPARRRIRLLPPRGRHRARQASLATAIKTAAATVDASTTAKQNLAGQLARQNPSSSHHE